MKFAAASYASARSTANLAKIAEVCGWDGIFLGDAIWTHDPMISLAAAAMVTSRIRLGTMVIPVPLRRPWKLASESLALDHLSSGRLILGLGAGAVWMGWQAFPDEPTGKKVRAGMLDETIDILTLLYRCEQFDYEGQYYHLKLTQMDLMYYPPKPVQQPRILLWVTGIWPRMQSMRRVLKCDGLLPQKITDKGEIQTVTPDELRQMKAYIDANRTLTTPFDYVADGKTGELDHSQQRDLLQAWIEVGATWWVEDLWEYNEGTISTRLQHGPPGY
jgi:hypothetical protein